MDAGTAAVIALCVVLVVWYGVGYLYNVRRGKRLFRWLDAGLEALGGERKGGWIGSAASGARFQILHADVPFRRLEMTLLLERREIPLLWLLDYLRGRRDRLIIKATLRSPRQGELEVTRSRRSFLVPTAVDHRRGSEWAGEEETQGLLVVHRGAGAERQVASLRPWLQAYAHALRRLVWQKGDPHIQIHLDLTHVAVASSKELLDGLQVAVNVPHVNK